ncbi:MAG: hypothetical protein KDC48_06945 [Planctomycetes bacterium]|nr:hypothetical protein [Planctomycetota bacterium]
MHARAILIGAAACLAPLAAQTYATDFESLNASAAGVIITGQDQYYIPVAGSLDGLVVTYAGNTLGVPANPNGGNNFYAGISQLTLVYARAQRPVTLPANGVVHVEFDMLCNYMGTGTPSNNIGSFSLQPSATATYPNLLARWPVGAVFPPPTFDADLVAGPGAGTQGPVGDPAFQNLASNVWHRWGCTFDLTAGTYVSFSITDGSTNVTTNFTPPTPILLPNPGTTPVTDFRFFTGGSENLFAIDNFVITYGANYDTFGSGCAGSNGAPTLAGNGYPTLGSAFTVTLGNLPLSLGFMATGFSNTTAFGGGIALPYSLTPQGFPGCDLLVDPIAVQFLVGANNSATWTFNIPNNTVFAGTAFYNQGVSLDSVPAAAFTNGGGGVIGL